MPRKKKSFIDRKTATTFHVVHKSTVSKEEQDGFELVPSASKGARRTKKEASSADNEEYYEHSGEEYEDEYEDDDGEWDDEDYEDYDDDDEDAEDGENANKPSSSEPDANSKKKKASRVVDKEYNRRDFELGEYGFPDDGYDYSQHLRVIGKGKYIPAVSVELVTTKLGKDPLTLVEHIAEKKKAEETKPDILEIFKDDVFVKEHVEKDTNKEAIEALRQIDPEVLALLEGDASECSADELEDDFVMQASEGKLYKKPSGKGWEDLPPGFNAEMMFRSHLSRLQSGAKHDSGDAGHYDSDDYDDGDDDDGEDDRRFETTSITSSMRANGFLDEKFEKIAQDFDDDQIGELDGDDPELQGTVDVNDMDAILDEFLKSRKPLKYDEVVRQMEKEEGSGGSEFRKRIIEQYQNEEEPKEEKQVVFVPEFRGKEWDCESILSTYSNLDNHPKLIGEENPRKIVLSKKTGIPLAFLQKPESDESSDGEERVNLGEARKKNETAEEKRMRKKALKAQRKERRQDKKDLKTTFKSEELKQAKVVTQPNFGKSVQRLA